jgi:hypothetical protein
MNMKKIALVSMVVCLLVGGWTADGRCQYVVCPENACWVVCPSGDLSFCFCIADAAGNPLTLPLSEVALEIQCHSGGLYRCAGESLWKQPFLRDPNCVASPGCGAEYCWQFQLGGCCLEATLTLYVWSVDLGWMSIYQQSVVIKSPDITGDGAVNLPDFATFAAAINQPYDVCADLNCDGIVDTEDVLPDDPFAAAFGIHYQHYCELTIPIDASTWGAIKGLYSD